MSIEGKELVFSRAVMDRYKAASKMLYKVYCADPFEIRTACEVGVGPLSFMVPYVGLAQKMILIEPHHDIVQHTKTYMPPDFVHQAAVAHKECRLNFRDNGSNGTGFLSMLDWAPWKGRRGVLRNRYRVDCYPFSHWDDGSIDLINIDCEGSEHFVISNMVSRPVLICIEIEESSPNAKYMLDWLDKEGYKQEVYSDTAAWITPRGGGVMSFYRRQKK